VVGRQEMVKQKSKNVQRTFAEDQPQNEMNTVMDQRTSLLIKW
jgi:hypothetical protein